VWKAFPGYMLQWLDVPRNRFKALEWKPLVLTEVERNPELAIQWRGGNVQRQLAKRSPHIRGLNAY
jgi:hypothetical protein